ncbi:HalOD1 output domain-containing protein [Haladaptatus pallidirubidus]|nr:HalOD1 output domain-containing protein [Haladaptatus pallidirubidus]
MTEYSTPDSTHSNNISSRPPTHQSDSLSKRVVEAVAHVVNCSSSELEPLYNVVDPDALDSLFAPMDGKMRTDVKLEFEYAGCDVVVYSSGAIDVVELNVSEEPRTE